LPDLQYLLAMIHARRGNRSEAEQALARAREHTAPILKGPGELVVSDWAQPWNHRLVTSMLNDEAEKAVGTASRK
jgi:hypothetical protein